MPQSPAIQSAATARWAASRWCHSPPGHRRSCRWEARSPCSGLRPRGRGRGRMRRSEQPRNAVCRRRTRLFPRRGACPRSRGPHAAPAATRLPSAWPPGRQWHPRRLQPPWRGGLSRGRSVPAGAMLSPSRVHQIGLASPRDPDSGEDTELGGRDTIADRLSDEVSWLRHCAAWLAHLDADSYPPAVNLRPGRRLAGPGHRGRQRRAGGGGHRPDRR